MKTLQDYIDKLNQLNFKEMYEGDFFLTWEKTDDELEAVFTVADALRYMRENNISTKIFESGLQLGVHVDRLLFKYLNCFVGSVLLYVTLRSPRGRVAFPPSRAGLLAALRPLARPRFGPGSPARRLSASYLISLLVLPARNWDTSAVLFSSLYRPGTAAYRAAQVTRSCFQVISLGA